MKTTGSVGGRPEDGRRGCGGRRRRDRGGGRGGGRAARSRPTAISMRARCMPRHMWGPSAEGDHAACARGRCRTSPGRPTGCHRGWPTRRWRRPGRRPGSATPAISVSSTARPGGDEQRRLPADRLLHRLLHQRAVGAQGVELVGVREQAEEEVARGPVGGLGAGGEQEPEEREDLLVVEDLAVELGGDEVADDVVAGIGAALVDDGRRGSPASTADAASPRSGSAAHVDDRRRPTRGSGRGPRGGCRGPRR